MTEELHLSCDCGAAGIAYTDDLFEDAYVVCTKCARSIYAVSCRKCETGFAFPQSEIKSDSWRCAACKAIYPLEKNAIKKLDFHYRSHEKKETGTAERIIDFVVNIFSKG